MKQSGIEPATCRFKAYSLDQHVTAPPPTNSTGLDLITQIFVERLTKCENRFQPLFTNEYIPQNHALKQPQFYVLMFRDQLHNHKNTGNASAVTVRQLRETTVAVEKKYLIF
jgi:hypothetical protein